MQYGSFSAAVRASSRSTSTISWSSGTANGFTNRSIESGLIQTRALLEFIGLRRKPDSKTELQEVRTRRPDDVGIEQFSLSNVYLAKVSRHDLATMAPEGAEEMLAQTLAAADKALAHLTYGFDRTKDGAPIQQVFQMVPQLVVDAFHRRLNIDPPPEVVTVSARVKVPPDANDVKAT